MNIKEDKLARSARTNYQDAAEHLNCMALKGKLLSEVNAYIREMERAKKDRPGFFPNFIYQHGELGIKRAKSLRDALNNATDSLAVADAVTHAMHRAPFREKSLMTRVARVFCKEVAPKDQETPLDGISGNHDKGRPYGTTFKAEKSALLISQGSANDRITVKIKADAFLNLVCDGLRRAHQNLVPDVRRTPSG